MKIPGYTIDLEKATKIINKKKYKLVALQFPEGLKLHVLKFLEFLESKTNSQYLVYEDTCFGACDLVSGDLKRIGVDFAIQIGHTKISCLPDPFIPTMFINALSQMDVTDVVKKATSKLKGKKIGVVTTSQHVHNLPKIKDILVEKGFEPVVGKGDRRIEFKAQVIGCNFSAATNISDKVDMFLFVGSGSFHPLGLMLSCKKPVVVADPYENSVRSDELDDLKDAVLRQRYGAIARSKDAKMFGILVGTKSGQQRMNLATHVKNMISSKSRKSFFIVSNFFNPSNLDSYRDVDCFVSTACPRIAIDDYMRYKSPIITPVELEILLGFKEWDDYRFDEILNP